MAILYYDHASGSGFGTLTGAWNTTSALWTTDSTGVAARITHTFTSADIAQFGAVGTTGTGGTATIANGVTVTLNGITAENLIGGQQTIVPSGTGNIVLAGTSPTITANASGQLVFTALMSGTVGFTKAGPQGLYLQGAANSISGVCTINAGFIVLGTYMSGGVAVLPNITSYTINNTDNAGALAFFGLTGATISQPFTGPASDTAGFACYNPGGITLSHAASCAAWKGYFYVDCANQAGAQGVLTLAAFPENAGKLTFANNCNSTNSRTNSLIITGNGGTTAALIDIVAYNTTAPASSAVTQQLVDNSTGPSYFTGGALLRATSVSGASQVLQLAGSNTSSNFNSAIDQATGRGTLALTKAGAGKWALSGANTYTGTTTVSAGTLSAQSSSALGPDSTGSGGAISNTGGTLELANSTNLDKSGCPIQQVSVVGRQAFQVPDGGGDNTLQCAGITLNSNVNFNIGVNAILRLRNTGAMSGAYNVYKNGLGELDLGAAPNNYTGSTTTTLGTLTVGASCASSTPGPLGNATSTVIIGVAGGDIPHTFKYNGDSAGTISRAVQLNGTFTVLDSSGTGAVQCTNLSLSSGTEWLYLNGSNTLTNQVSSAIANGTSAVHIVKNDGGTWSLTGALTYTGVTAVNDGILDLGNTPRALSAIHMGGGTLTNGTSSSVAASSDVFFVNTGSVIKARLTAANTVAVGTGGYSGTLYPQVATGSNSYTGATTVAAGSTLQLACDAAVSTGGNGRMTGLGNVTVSGTLKTASTTLQRGQARYGGNLTFASGATMYIGAAAV